MASDYIGQVYSETKSTAKDVLKDQEIDEEKRLNSELLVFQNVAEKISDQLTNGEKRRQTLLVVGMPGIGKTTLADSVFQHASITSYFHVRAKCCFTQVYQKRRLLLEILQQVTSLDEKFHEMEDGDLEKVLFQQLKGRKYLIFLDDIWNLDSWKDMKISFPEDENGSRIMFTSRFHDIVSQEEPDSVTYPLYPLSDDECWKMLQVKLFQGENCPEELKKVGHEIATSCKGLPLTVDLVAGVLRPTERKEDCWQHVTKSLRTLAGDPQGQCMKVLALSYHHLPDHLKPCFLYFGAFPEDTEVPARKLIMLWIAEEFVQQQIGDEQSLEDVAEVYLNDLIARSLVIASKRRTFGGVKASRVHDLLRDFALAKAREKSFFLQIDGTANFSTLSSDDYTWSQQNRLCICPPNWIQFVASKPSGPCVRSLLCSANLSREYPLSFASRDFRFLRVLDLHCILTSYISLIFMLVHLRFLAIFSNEKDILRKLFNLTNLETFLLRRTSDRVLLLDDIWDMQKLRNFHVDGSYRLQQNNLDNKCSQLNDLQTLSTPLLQYGEDTESIMRRFPNLQKLSCKFLESWDSTENCYRFPILDVLVKLESLKVTYEGAVPYPCEFTFPPYLKKLTLSEFRLPWAEISIIGQLQHLEVLKLRIRAFEGKVWKMNDEEFPNLKFLNLTQLDIEEWNASEEDLPSLERLEVHKCEQLKELPSCFADKVTLRSIQLWLCNPSAEISLQEIKQQQDDLAADQFEINMDPSTIPGGLDYSWSF